MLQSIRSHLPLILTAAMVSACGDDKAGDGGDETAGTETADTGTSDEIGDSGTTTSGGTTTTGTTTTGDTTTDDTTTTTTTTTDGSCSIGSEGCECTMGGGCDPGLECLGGICTAPDTTTDTTTGVDTACAMDVSFEIAAVDAANADGWDPAMSMIGEGMIMVWDQQTMDATINWDIDVPCDDTWHVWVRGFDQGNADSFFATVDGAPNPAAIFELDCTNGPNQGTYAWKELNWRDPADPGCTYLQDPWTQDWLLGVHQLELTYRESAALSKLWITNTDLTPP